MSFAPFLINTFLNCHKFYSLFNYNGVVHILFFSKYMYNNT